MKTPKGLAKRLHKRYTGWAMVTGASSGIGKELALRLADCGYNLIVTGRHKDRLDDLAAQLQRENGVCALVKDGDLGQKREVEDLIAFSEDYPIGIAVMNAGFGSSGSFTEADLSTEISMLNLNCQALMMLTHHFSNKFVSNGGGGIVLISSMLGFQGVPFSAHYAATKSYVLSLGEALTVELKPKGVDVLTVTPGPVRTGFFARAGMLVDIAMPVSKIGVSILKSLGRQERILPGMLAKILVYSLRMLPRWIKVRIMGSVMRRMSKSER